MKIKDIEPEALQFTGDNFDELKAFQPVLQKYTFRTKEDIENVQSSENFHGYTVGWEVDAGIFGKGPHEALPGFWVVKEGDKYRILDPIQFKEEFQS